jgi:hypothetical protein
MKAVIGDERIGSRRHRSLFATPVEKNDPGALGEDAG